MHGGKASVGHAAIRARIPDPGRWARPAVLLMLAFQAGWAPLNYIDSASRVPAVWPATALLVGLTLAAPLETRRKILGLGSLLVLVAHLTSGYPVLVALGFTLSCAAATWVVRTLLVRGRGERPVGLLDEGDVSQFVGSISAGSIVAALGYGLTDRLTHHGTPWLGGLATFGAYAAAMMVVLPLFLETPAFEPLARSRERALQCLVTLATTVVVFLNASWPPIVFAVMPMFAWYALRGTLREATLLLNIVGLIGTSMTLMHLGPIWGLEQRYDLAPEFVGGVLQLFLLDCGLILLPLSVMVTQQRRATAQAAAEREKLRRLVASATGTAVISTGRDGRISVFNPGAEAVFGLPAGEALGRLPDDLVGTEELRRQAAALGAVPAFADICRVSVLAGDTQRLWRITRSDGEVRSLRMTLTPVPDQEGLLSGYLATGEDVTQREEAHQALLATLEHERAAADHLRELERVKGDFVSTVSHELRTPITSILGYTELLEDGALGDLPPEQQEVVGRVARNSSRLLALVDDLLTLSQIEVGALRMDPVVTDLRAAVHSAHEALAATLETRRLYVRVLLPDQPVLQHGDPAQLERMVLNLLTNAVKFTPDGGAVTARVYADSDVIRLEVADTGLGIPEAEQGQLFTRFFRSSTATERAIQGTGLGLTIVKAIVTLHGGDVAIRSAHGAGTTVTVWLPRLGSGLGAADVLTAG